MTEVNLREFVDDEDNATTMPQFDVNVTQQPQQPQENERDAHQMLYYVMGYVCLALGVPGNVLSAIIWLRRHVTGKNSSALYLAVLAINDLVHVLNNSVFLHVVPSIFDWGSRGFSFLEFIRITTELLEPLLVLSFSVERLIAISCPLQVRCNL